MSAALNHVLIVEPNETVCAEICRLLFQAHVAPALVTDVRTADEGLQALNALSDQPPDVVILAFDALGERGDEWLTGARGSNNRISVPVVLLGDNEGDTRLDIALAAGADDYLLLNGLTTRRLLRTLENVLARHQLSQRLSDMTTRKEAKEELRMNEEKLRVVLTGSTITVMTVDRDLRYTWIHNPQSGFTVEEMLGKRDDEIFPPEISRPFIEFKEEALTAERPIRREFELVWNGIFARFDTSAEPLHDAEGNIIGATIITHNITDRVQSQDRADFLAEASRLLSASLDYETTLQQVARSMVPKLADWCSVDIVTDEGQIEQVAVAHVDPDKVEWAKHWRQHHPPALDDPSGLAHVIRTGQPEFYPEISQEMLEAAAQSEEQRQVLERVPLRSAIVVPLTTRKQIMGGITLVWSDSDRRYTEEDLEFAQELAQRAATAVDHARLYRESQIRAEELRRLNETLEQRVDERTTELQRSNQDLDQFAYVASHDLKAPLRAIDHLSTCIIEDAGHLLPVRSREHLNKMRGRLQRMEGLLDDLLTYSRAGRSRGDATFVDTNELVARVIETVSPSDNIKVSIVGELPKLYTYSAPLETVLRNLVNNAIKHHDKPNGNVRISATDKGDMVEFAVADDGPGIDPIFHARIFEMFQTLRPRDQVEGSGIGLSVVEKIVASVGGTITVSSAIGNGATFRFTWPREFPP